MTIKTQTLLMVTLLLVVAVFATAGVVVWGSRRALLAESETQGLVIARLLARSAAFGAQVTSDVEKAIGEQMIVEATIAAHLVALGEAAGVGAKEINRRLRQIADDTVLDEIWITDEKGHAYLRNHRGNRLHVQSGSGAATPSARLLASAHRKKQKLSSRKRASAKSTRRFSSTWGSRGWISRASSRSVITPPCFDNCSSAWG